MFSREWYSGRLQQTHHLSHRSYAEVRSHLCIMSWIPVHFCRLQLASRFSETGLQPSHSIWVIDESQESGHNSRSTVGFERKREWSVFGRWWSRGQFAGRSQSSKYLLLAVFCILFSPIDVPATFTPCSSGHLFCRWTQCMKCRCNASFSSDDSISAFSLAPTHTTCSGAHFIFVWVLAMSTWNISTIIINNFSYQLTPAALVLFLSKLWWISTTHPQT